MSSVFIDRITRGAHLCVDAPPGVAVAAHHAAHRRQHVVGCAQQDERAYVQTQAHVDLRLKVVRKRSGTQG